GAQAACAAGRGRAAGGRGDVLAAAVAGRAVQGQPVVAGGGRLGVGHARGGRLAEARSVADEADAHAAPMQLVDLAVEGVDEQLHQRADLVLRTAPVLAREREQGQCADAGVQAEIDAQVDRARAGAMADDARPVALLRPAAVAVHDDGQVARDSTVGGHQTAISSCSLALTTSSTSLIALSVIFCISASLRAASSSLTCFSFSSSLTCWLASRRMLRMATLVSSPSPCTTLDSSLRRSSVSAGRLSRIT